MAKARIYEKIVKACSYCPAHAAGWSDCHCLALKPAREIKGQYLKGFPKWCPLKEVDN